MNAAISEVGAGEGLSAMRGYQSGAGERCCFR